MGRVLNPSAAEGGRFAAADGLRTRPTSIKPEHAYALVFIVALLWIVSPVLVHGVPLPWMHDDYSCLLGAEMVAQGHPWYPPHPMWRHFETMHQLQMPRRTSKYPPGQALLLAAGIRFLGLAIAAEWLLIGGWTIPLRYAAPAAAAAWILLVSSVMTLATMFPHHRGQVLALLIGLTFVVNACGVWWNWTVGRDPSSEPERRRIEQSLRADGKRNLILVAPNVYDFVYNHADIDAQDVVWARDLGPAANQSLLRYYSDRVVWTLTNGAGGRLLVTRIQNVDRAGGLH